MANYIKESLEPGEEIIFNGRLHWSAIFSYILWATLFGLATIALLAVALLVVPENESAMPYYYSAIATALIGILIYIVGVVVRTRTEFAVTNSRFIQKDGILNIKMTEIPLFKVETVNFYQTIWQRMLGTGCLELVGSGGTSHQVHSVQHPMALRKIVVGTINKRNEAQKQEATTPAEAE